MLCVTKEGHRRLEGPTQEPPTKEPVRGTGEPEPSEGRKIFALGPRSAPSARGPCPGEHIVSGGPNMRLVAGLLQEVLVPLGDLQVKAHN